MKTFFVSLICISTSITSLAVANESFEIVRDGQNYLCTSTEAHDPQVIARCTQELQFAYPDSIVKKICRGARGEAPAKCAVELKHRFNDETVGTICSGAQSKYPEECAKDLKHRFEDQIVAKICRRANSSRVAECAKDLKHRQPDEQIPGLCSTH